MMMNANRHKKSCFTFPVNFKKAVKYFSSVSSVVFLFPPLVEQNTYINVITLRKKGHATKRNNVETCKNSINYTS